MKVAVINNGVRHPERILALIRTADTSVFNHEEVANLSLADFDLMILTGSNRFPIHYHQRELTPVLDLIRLSHIPTVGICYGCQLIATAFGATLVDRGSEAKHRDLIKIDVTVDDPIFGGRQSFMAYDAHRWVIDTVPEELAVIATSEHGPEVIKHRSRPMYGFQWHPEKMTTLGNGDEIFYRLVELHTTGFTQ